MECSKLLEQRKKTKLQWLQNTSQMTGTNLNNVRHETSRTFRNKKREELETKNMNKHITELYGGIN
jgi:hypothetical protein